MLNQLREYCSNVATHKETKAIAKQNRRIKREVHMLSGAVVDHLQERFRIHHDDDAFFRIDNKSTLVSNEALMSCVGKLAIDMYDGYGIGGSAAYNHEASIERTEDFTPQYACERRSVQSKLHLVFHRIVAVDQSTIV